MLCLISRVSKNALTESITRGGGPLPSAEAEHPPVFSFPKSALRDTQKIN